MTTEPGRSRTRLAIGIALLTAVAGTGLGAAIARSRSPATAPATAGTLPVLGPAHDVYDGDIGDPVVLTVPPAHGAAPVTQYFMFGTNDWPAHVPAARSTDLNHWQSGPDALPVAPRWAGPDPTGSLTWAPAALATGNRYLLYVTVPFGSTGRQCIAAQTSPAPQGPYTDTSNGPLVCQLDQGGSIDPSVTRDPSGHLHLLWKNDGNCCGIPVSLWEQDLGADGLTLTGSAHRLLTADQPWQGGIIENPVVTPATHGGWWLFYSGNIFDRAEYGTGLAYCPRLEGPCQDAQTGPFLASHDQQFSPGGLEIFRDAHGTRWAVYAIWNRPSRNGRYFCCRSVYLAPLTFA